MYVPYSHNFFLLPRGPQVVREVSRQQQDLPPPPYRARRWVCSSIEANETHSLRWSAWTAWRYPIAESIYRGLHPIRVGRTHSSVDNGHYNLLLSNSQSLQGLVVWLWLFRAGGVHSGGHFYARSRAHPQVITCRLGTRSRARRSSSGCVPPGWRTRRCRGRERIRSLVRINPILISVLADELNILIAYIHFFKNKKTDLYAFLPDVGVEIEGNADACRRSPKKALIILRLFDNSWIDSLGCRLSYFRSIKARL